MQKKVALTGIVLLTLLLIPIYLQKKATRVKPPVPATSELKKEPRHFSDDFTRNEILKEGGEMNESSSSEWWVNSGAYLYVENGLARTIFGELPINDPRRIIYNKQNPTETDKGYHPQNIFRLVTRSQWQNFEQSVYFRMKKYILSNDEHRSESNGILLFNHYEEDGQTLYYAGLRVDGYLVIKKKYHGTYFTMINKQIYQGSYNRNKSPNLIPLNTWIGIKTKVENLNDGKVSIKLYTDIGKTGDWILQLEIIDDGKIYQSTPAILDGYAGIRTDFMDVEFSNYMIEEINPI